MNYIPTTADIHWARSTLRVLKDGGRIGVPYTGQVFLVSHKERSVVLLEGPLMDLDKMSATMLAAGYGVAVSIQWTRFTGSLALDA